MDTIPVAIKTIKLRCEYLVAIPLANSIRNQHDEIYMSKFIPNPQCVSMANYGPPLIRNRFSAIEFIEYFIYHYQYISFYILSFITTQAKSLPSNAIKLRQL